MQFLVNVSLKIWLLAFIWSLKLLRKNCSVLELGVKIFCMSTEKVDDDNNDNDVDVGDENGGSTCLILIIGMKFLAVSSITPL